MDAKKLVIVQGLPGSGKSTWAADQLLRALKDGMTGMCVNQDEIRRELGWTSWNTYTWDFKSAAESRVPNIKTGRIRDAMVAGVRLIISNDTNLKERYRLPLVALADGYGYEVINHIMPTPLEETIRRDQLRGDRCVGEKTIRRMAGEWARTMDPGKQPLFGRVKPSGLPKAMISDLDGTLSLFGEKGHRGPYDASKCDEDEINVTIKRVLRGMQLLHGWQPIYLSGRSENFREQTERFLQQNGAPNGPLYMRAVGDSRIDWLVKGELFERNVRSKFDVQMVFDDRDQMVKFWRGIGLACWQVAPGDF